MLRPMFSFGLFAPQTRRLKSRRRPAWAILETLDPRLMLSAAAADTEASRLETADTDSSAADTFNATAVANVAVAEQDADTLEDYDTSDHIYPMMNDMMSADADEMPVMMMTANTMMLSPAVTSPVFRGQLFEEAAIEENILVADPAAEPSSRPSTARPLGTPDLSTPSVTTADSSQLAREPQLDAADQEADLLPVEPELDPIPETLPESLRNSDERPQDAETDASDGTRPSVPVPEETPSNADDAPVDVSLGQPARSLAERITGLEIPSLDELFSTGYQFAVEGVTVADMSPGDSASRR